MRAERCQNEGVHEAGLGFVVEGGFPVEMPGLSCSLRGGDDAFHTYSTFDFAQ